MMALPVSWQLQLALRSFLSSSTEVASLLGTPPRLYDDVPDDPVYPFLTLGETRTEAVLEVPGARRHELRLNVYSRWGGRQELKRVVDAVVDRLDRATFPIDDHQLVQCRFVFSDIVQRRDPDVFMAVIRFRCVTQGASN